VCTQRGRVAVGQRRVHTASHVDDERGRGRPDGQPARVPTTRPLPDSLGDRVFRARTSSDGGCSRLRSSAALPAAGSTATSTSTLGCPAPTGCVPERPRVCSPRAPWSPGSVRRSCGASTSPTNGTTSSWSCRRGRTHVGSPASGCAACHWTRPTCGSSAGCAWCPRWRRRRGWQPCSIQTRRSWRSTAWSRLASSTWRRSAPAWPRRALHRLGCGGRVFERTGGRSRRRRRDCAS
jgi:hypothetical protein